MARTCILRRFVCRCHDVFLWSYVCFLLLRFRFYTFVEAAALRSIVLRYAGVPIATHIVSFFLFFPFCLFGDVAFSEYFFLYHFRFCFVRRVPRTFFPSGWCFFYLVTTGWIFDISLCENSINQSINHGDNPLLRPTGIQIATKSCATLQEMAPTNIKTVHQTSLLHIESSLDRLGLLLPTHDQRSQQQNGQNTLQPVLINKSKFLKATHRSKIRTVLPENASLSRYKCAW